MDITRGHNKKKRFVAVQEKRGRHPVLLPQPGNETRWDSDHKETTRANLIMGDLADTITELYSRGGDNHDKLTDDERAANNISRFLYSDEQKKALRQFEAGAEVATVFSKFLQDKRFTFSYVLLEAQFAVASASEPFFGMRADVSHSHATTDLRKRGEHTILVKKAGTAVDDEVDKGYVTTETMVPCVEKFRELYSSDLEERLQLNGDTLPEAYSIPALLNPLFGMEKRIVQSGLMNQSQYYRAKRTLISRMQTILDRRAPTTIVVDSGTDDSDGYDSEEDELPEHVNANYETAVQEFDTFQTFKLQRYHPEVIPKKARVLEGEKKTIIVGPVLEFGKALPSGRNLADYVCDDSGRIDLLTFFSDHSKYFPTLSIVVQMYAHCRVVEVGCERFFGIAGYTSNPRRAQLNVRSYERIAMLSQILRNVYIDDKLVAEEYLRRAKSGAWKKGNAEDALKCWNLERVLEAEMYGQPAPAELTMQEFEQEPNEP